MNSSQPIAFLDSAIDGLPYLEKIRRSLPNEGFVYLADNAASVVALASLRSAYKIPFVGGIPAVKPAAAKTAERCIGLLATNGTVVDTYTDTLMDLYITGEFDQERYDALAKRFTLNFGGVLDG